MQATGSNGTRRNASHHRVGKKERNQQGVVERAPKRPASKDSRGGPQNLSNMQFPVKEKGRERSGAKGPID